VETYRYRGQHTGLEGKRQVGAIIVKSALEEPLRQIAFNAGVEGATVVQRVKAESGAMGYDAATDTYVDLMEAGIIDPTQVSRTALQNAASVAGLLLTTEALVTDVPEKPKAAHEPMSDMDY
jgi:chaperonin GroEL